MNHEPIDHRDPEYILIKEEEKDPIERQRRLDDETRLDAYGVDLHDPEGPEPDAKTDAEKRAAPVDRPKNRMQSFSMSDDQFHPLSNANMEATIMTEQLTPNALPTILTADLSTCAALQRIALESARDRAVSNAAFHISYAERRKQQERLKVEQELAECPHDGFLSCLYESDEGQTHSMQITNDQGHNRDARTPEQLAAANIDFALALNEILNDTAGPSFDIGNAADSTITSVLTGYGKWQYKKRVQVLLDQKRAMGFNHQQAMTMKAVTDQIAAIESEVKLAQAWLRSEYRDRTCGNSDNIRGIDSAWDDVPSRDRMDITARVWGSMCHLVYWRKTAVATEHRSYLKWPERFMADFNEMSEALGTYIDTFQQAIEHELNHHSEEERAKLNIDEPKSCDKVLEEAIALNDKKVDLALAQAS